MTGDTVLLTLGRLPVALDLARSFKRAGWRVLAADPLRMTMAHASRAVDRTFRVPPPASDPAGFAGALGRIARRESVSLIVPVSEECLHVAALSAPGRGNPPVFGPPAPDLEALHDKYRFAVTARAAGLAVPDTCLPGGAAAAALAERGPVVVKPRHGSAGRGIRYYPAGAMPAASDGDLLQ
ncbi:MAG: hypothetical protein AAFX58_03865, partial [Pseudomonadota bacterium]